MPDLNVTLRDASTLRRKILNDLDVLAKMYGGIEKETSGRFQEEYTRNSRLLSGLEDFFMLSRVVRKNSLSIKRAYAILHQMGDTSGYDVSEDTIEDLEIEALLK
jgi:hypothetical protein